MTPPINDEELNAVKEANQLMQSCPREAPLLLGEIVDEYKSEGKTACALEARRYQCFSFIQERVYIGATLNKQFHKGRRTSDVHHGFV